MDQNINEAAQRALDNTGHMIDELGSRPSGSDRSRKAADALHEQAASFADKVWSEDFSVHPKAFLGWIRLVVGIYLIAVALLWLQIYWVAALLTSVGLVIMTGQFFLYRELIDPLFKIGTGRSVLAVVDPDEAPHGQLIVSGHHDSAFVFNFLVHQPGLYPIRVMGGIASFIVLLLTSWILTIWQALAVEEPEWSVVAAALFSLLFLLVGQLWWFASSEATPGAGETWLPARRPGRR